MIFDLIVRGGTLFDGSGEPPRRADVGLRDGRVAEVGDLVEAQAERVVDATGARVLPGFVDVHTHYDLCLGWPSLTEHCLRQGITTVVGGNCGLGDPDVDAVLDRAAEANLGVHFGVLAPLGPLRSRVVPRVEGRPAAGAELDAVARQVATALDAGALGVSWGPYHANALMDAAELEAALGVAAARGKPFCVHRRSEGTGGLAATQEALDLARASGVRLQISHLKSAGRLNWSEFEPVLECLEAARRDVDLAVDVYPYDASLTYLSAVVPTSLKADGDLLARLGTAEGFAAAAAGVERWFTERQGPEHVVLLEPALRDVEPGSTLADAAKALDLADPAEAALRLIQADAAGTGGWAIYQHMMAPEHVEQILGFGYAAIASDAVPEDGGDAMSLHPRAFATYARALLRAEGDDVALADVVRRCTRFPAERLGIDRGLLRPGAVADLLVLRDLRDLASYSTPDRYPSGIEAVVVGGRLVKEGATLNPARAEVLRG